MRDATQLEGKSVIFLVEARTMGLENFRHDKIRTLWASAGKSEHEVGAGRGGESVRTSLVSEFCFPSEAELHAGQFSPEM